MSWALGVLIFLVGLVAGTLLGDLISEEIRGWLDLAPRGLLRLAARQLDPVQRETIYQDEWLPELIYILQGKESRPITRLIFGMAYATGIVIDARRIARRLDRGRARLPASNTNMSADTDAQPWRPDIYMMSKAGEIIVKRPDKEEPDFYWVPSDDGEVRGAVVAQAKRWRGRPMIWPPPDQSRN